MSVILKLLTNINCLLGTIAPSWTARQVVRMFILPRLYTQRNRELQAEEAGQRFMIADRISAIRWLPAGDEEIKGKVLLVHGWEGRATQLSAFVPGLLEQGYEVLGVDMPAHGYSEGKRADIRMFADTLLETGSREGSFNIVIGHSMGAPSVAWAIARGLNTDKLVLISSPSRMDRVLKSFANYIGLPKNAAHMFVKHMSRRVGIPAESIDTSRFLESFQGSLLVIHDEEDREVHVSNSIHIAGQIKHAELYLTKNLGHRKILQAREVIDQVSSFISAEKSAPATRKTA